MDSLESERQSPRFYEFDGYRLEVASRVLLREGVPVAVSPKAVEALILLIEKRPALVQKTALMSALWPESFVEENNLAQCISALRRVLGDHREHPRYIATVSGRGYRFLRDVVVERFQEETVLSATRVADSRGLEAFGGSISPESEPQQPASLPGVPAAATGSGPATRFSRPALAVLLAVALLVLSAQTIYRWMQGPEPAFPYTPVVIVEVFRAAPQDAHLGSGIAEALIARLSRMPGVVIRPNALRAEPEMPPEPQTLPGVDAVLRGTIERTGDRVQLAVELAALSDAASLWKASFDVPWADVQSLQDTISERVGAALLGRLTPEQRNSLVGSPTTDPQAYERYLRSRYFWNQRTVDGFLKSIDEANAALAIDGRYALAYVALADSYALLGSSPTKVISRPEAMARARKAAETALAIDETLAEAHTSLAFVKMHYDWDWAAAEREFRRAIELRPDYPTAHHWYAILLTAHRRFDDALEEIELARRLDPLSLIINTDVAEVKLYAGQIPSAREQALHTLALNPDFGSAHYVLAFSYLLGDETPQHALAIEHFTRAGTLGWPWGESHAAYAMALKGDRTQALVRLRRLEMESRERPGMGYELAMLHAVLGDSTAAIRCLEDAYRERSGSLMLMDVDFRLSDLPADPRFADLRRRVLGR